MSLNCTNGNWPDTGNFYFDQCNLLPTVAIFMHCFIGSLLFCAGLYAIFVLWTMHLRNTLQGIGVCTVVGCAGCTIFFAIYNFLMLAQHGSPSFVSSTFFGLGIYANYIALGGMVTVSVMTSYSATLQKQGCSEIRCRAEFIWGIPLTSGILLITIPFMLVNSYVADGWSDDTRNHIVYCIYVIAVFTEMYITIRGYIHISRFEKDLEESSKNTSSVAAIARRVARVKRKVNNVRKGVAAMAIAMALFIVYLSVGLFVLGYIPLIGYVNILSTFLTFPLAIGIARVFGPNADKNSGRIYGQSETMD